MKDFFSFVPQFHQSKWTAECKSVEKIVPYLEHCVVIISPGLGLRLPFTFGLVLGPGNSGLN